MEKRVENKLKSLIEKSGNSDIDLVVNIETKAIAYSILCSSFAKGEIDEKQLDKAVRKLDSLLERDERKHRERSNVIELELESNKREKPHRNDRRRRWI